MPTAVTRVVVDASGALSPNDFQSGLANLRTTGIEVIAPSIDHLPGDGREIEVISDPRGTGTEEILAACAAAFPTPVTLGVITYISRGTDEDAHGVLERFEIAGEVRREVEDDEEIVYVTLARSDSRRVPESRLHTALEAALNCEVRIAYR